MATYRRDTLYALDKRLETRFLEAGDDIDKLKALEESLWIEHQDDLAQKKMGRVRTYDKWGIKAGEKVLELKTKDFESMHILGVF